MTTTPKLVRRTHLLCRALFAVKSPTTQTLTFVTQKRGQMLGVCKSGELVALSATVGAGPR